MTTSQPSASRLEIRRDVDDIAWNLLNSEENKFVKAHEQSEALEAKSAGLPVLKSLVDVGKESS